ncbi:hypothetical protein [Schleiferilactobacillus perolens]|nr:hypothetical protein [Schleiferilactobacillus perolens]MCI1891004.1 hypothetical protein [Schleiferilactobacillus harbinensis]MCI1913328.1 hypothetical protein [Schleiferilactobacillus harbinensis]MCI2171024.1 hypothetical protein [Schleiferilactobacillus perolens]
MWQAIAKFFSTLLGANRPDKWTEVSDEKAKRNIERIRQDNAKGKYR